MTEPQIPDPDASAQGMLLASQREALDRIQADNAAKIGEFARLAGPLGTMSLQLDLLNVRVFTLARKVFGDGSLELLQFQIDFERQVGQVLDSATSQVRQALLGAPLTSQSMPQMKNGRLFGPDGRPLS